MKKTWLTAVSVAGVIGTGSAAVMAGAVMNAGSSAPTSAPVPAQHGASLDTPRTVVYAVGDAARVTLSSAGGVLSVISTEPGAGWSVVSTSDAGPAVTVQLTDGTRIVTFTATVNGQDVKASVAAVLVTPTTDAAPASVPELIEQPAPTTPPSVFPPAKGDHSDAPAPTPAQPKPAASHSDESGDTEPQAPATTQPAKPIPPAATTAPSSAGSPSGDDSHEGQGSNDNGAEHDDD